MRVQIWLIFVAPLALLGGLYFLGLTIPVPHLGRDYVVRLLLPAAGDPVDLPAIEGPGHGGKDPGASVEGFQEKDIALGLALALRDRLVAEGGIRVALTRVDDRFLVLAERPEIARRPRDW